MPQVEQVMLFQEGSGPQKRRLSFGTGCETILQAGVQLRYQPDMGLPELCWTLPFSHLFCRSPASSIGN